MNFLPVDVDIQSINLEPYFLLGHLNVNFIQVLVACCCSLLLGSLYLFALVRCWWVIIDKGSVFLLQPGSYPAFCPSHQPTNQTQYDTEPFPKKTKVLT